ncbi:MAG TPA: hypothetical protein VLV81_12145 [Acidimicrobiia bacterium]|nr:hypothetical protein [Acidimicrobiia bacterium]
MVLFDTGLHPDLATSTARLRSVADLFSPDVTDAEVSPHGVFGSRPNWSSLDPNGNPLSKVSLAYYYATLAQWVGVRVASVLPVPGTVISGIVTRPTACSRAAAGHDGRHAHRRGEVANRPLIARRRFLVQIGRNTRLLGDLGPYSVSDGAHGARARNP